MGIFNNQMDTLSMSSDKFTPDIVLQLLQLGIWCVL
jgi:hypothetical protein